MDMRKLIKL